MMGTPHSQSVVHSKPPLKIATARRVELLKTNGSVGVSGVRLRRTSTSSATGCPLGWLCRSTTR
jgi:hypothetical protein